MNRSVYIFLIAMGFVFHQENHPPVVKIISPKAATSIKYNTSTRFEISVSDKEDGESAYQEIPLNEVLLQVKYIGDTSNISQESLKIDDGLRSMTKSNCLNCHAFNSKLIGPSFYEIGKKYSPDKPNTDLLVKHVKEGSSGVWGDIIMPTHPELSAEETRNMVQWILNNSKDESTSYYTGTEGLFKIKPPSSPSEKGGYLLFASYSDHGTKAGVQSSLTGHDVHFIRGKD